MYDTIIIGGGLGGLASGAILAQQGMHVCVLEQHTQAGGCLQSFTREGDTFDTGFHCVGGLRPGEVLYPFFRALRLLDLPWLRMDESAFEEVILGDKNYFIAQGYRRFIKTLAHEFPHEEAGLRTFVKMLRSVGQTLPKLFDEEETARRRTRKLFSHSAHNFLYKTIRDPQLRRVIAGASLKMEPHAPTLPLYTFAQIHNSFIQSAWRLRGGGMQIVRRLIEQIEAAGGTVRTNARVTRLIGKSGRITAAELANGEQIEARFFISDIHPAQTLALVDTENRLMRQAYRRRVNELQNTFGFFTLQIHTPYGSMPYFNRNISVFDEGVDPWDITMDRTKQRTLDSGVLISCRPSEMPKGRFTTSVDILLPIPNHLYQSTFAQFAAQEGYSALPAYQLTKKICSALSLVSAMKHIPRMPPTLENFTYTASSPLTYLRYTGTPNGSAYGIRKDYREPLRTLLPPRTPIPNLLLTGQNLNVHGVLGVTVTAFLTCAELLSRPVVRRMLEGLEELEEEEA